MTKHYMLTLKKMLSISAVALFGVTGVNAQVSTFPWTENFEDSSPTRAAWTQIYEVNTMAWTYATQPSTGGTGVTAFDGTKMANYPADSHNFDKTKLVSPILDLSGASSATVRFHYRNKFWSPDQNWLRIFYRTSATAAWVQIVEFHSDVPNWTSSGIINLPTPTATYQIAVECETDYGYSTTVDALVVEATPLSVAQQSTLTANYFPNPTSNLLHFSANGEIDEIKIYNYLGQMVLESKIQSSQGQLDLSRLNTGNYIVRALNEKGSHTFKLIKN